MKTKKIFGETLQINDIDTLDTYSYDISPMFEWMTKLHLAEGSAILDVGANIGIFSLCYASIFKTSYIHSFEPVPFIYKHFQGNLELNRELSKSITTYNFGLSNCQERKELSIPNAKQHDRYQNNAKNDIRLFSILGEGEEKFYADFMSMDDWVNTNSVENIGFIKIDVEGYELRVLEGSSKTLLRDKPIVMFELNDLTLTLSGSNESDYLEFAHRHGYDIYGLEYGYKRDLLKISSVDQINLISDIILFPKN